VILDAGYSILDTGCSEAEIPSLTGMLIVTQRLAALREIFYALSDRVYEPEAGLSGLGLFGLICSFSEDIIVDLFFLVDFVFLVCSELFSKIVWTRITRICFFLPDKLKF